MKDKRSKVISGDMRGRRLADKGACEITCSVKHENCLLALDSLFLREAGLALLNSSSYWPIGFSFWK